MPDISNRPILPLPNGNLISRNISLLQDSVRSITSDVDDIGLMNNPIVNGKVLTPSAIYVLEKYFWFSKSKVDSSYKNWNTKLALNRNFIGFFGITYKKLTLFHPDDAIHLTLMVDIKNMMP